MFNYEGRFSYNYNIGTNIPYGVSHHDDLIYLLFNSGRFPLFNQTDPEADTVRRMTSLYARFATTGHPFPQESSIKWTPITKDCLNFLNISNVFLMKKGLPYPRRMQVWETQLPLDQPYRQLNY
uniref:Carboxylesterase type B domain-containing protein n=1 Tax=Homalodisca liturata TaxID=320908 RepID=A0A1B6HMA3_9HEMI